MGLAVAQTLIRGALTVLTVVVAIDLLDTGEPGVGLLSAAIGAGAVLGSLAASLLVDTRRLGALVRRRRGALGCARDPDRRLPPAGRGARAAGLCRCRQRLIDLGGFTLLGRIAPDEVLARVFGVLESLVALSMGVGAIGTSLLIGLVGVRPTLVIVGLLCPICAALSWARLRGMDRSLDVRDREIALLQGVTMLNALPLPAIEQLARVLEPVEVAAGATVFDQGDVGDRYFVIESGEVEVVGDGRVITTLEAGQGFGEIALVRRGRRTASVRASSALRLQSLRSEHFIAIVCGFAPSSLAGGHDASTRCSTASRRPAPQMTRLLSAPQGAVDEVVSARHDRQSVCCSSSPTSADTPTT